VQINGFINSTCQPVQQFWDNQLNFNSVITNVCPGTHTICINDACGCQVCDSVNVSFLTSAGGDLDAKADVTVSPNPASSQVMVQATHGDPMSLRVYNALGQELVAFEFSGQLTIDLQECLKGVYFLSFYDKVNGAGWIRRLIIE
jgi:hypothetical protein